MKEHWIETELQKVCSIRDNLRKPINSKTRQERIEGKQENELFPYYGATGQVGYIDDFLTDGKYLLIGEDGAPFYDFAKPVAYTINGKTWVNNHAHILDPRIIHEYLKHYLNNFDYHGYVTGTTRLKLTQGSLKKIPIKLPPLPEQRAIVAKIETLFSELENGIANLKAAQEKLKIYRQSVLKKAFEGELTKEWRAKQKDLPTAQELLNQIKEERELYYQEQLTEWQQKVKEWEANGKVGKKPKKPRRLDVSRNDDYLVNFNIPPNWSQCQIGDTISDLTDYHANGSYVVLKENVQLTENEGFAVMIRATNFEKKDFVKDLKFVDEHGYNFLAKSKLFGGEILIGKIGNAGRVYLMPHLNRKASLAMNLFALRFRAVNSKYIYYHLLNQEQEKEIGNYVKGVGNPTIDKISIRSVHIHLCSVKEQTQIVQEIESRLSVVDDLEHTINQNLEKAEALRQSILKKAFNGELLTQKEIKACMQEPDWEPAEKLLERIKTER